MTEIEYEMVKKTWRDAREALAACAFVIAEDAVEGMVISDVRRERFRSLMTAHEAAGKALDAAMTMYHAGLVTKAL